MFQITFVLHSSITASQRDF